MLVCLTSFASNSTYLQTLNREESWKQDIRTFKEELPKRHLNPFTILSKDSFLKECDQLEADVPKLTDAQIYVRLMQILAKIGDGHTSAYGGVSSKFKAWPVGLRRLSDGWFVGAQDKHLPGMIGCRVLKIGKVDINVAAQKAITLVPHENDSWILSQTPGLLTNSDMMRALGVLGAPAQDSITVLDKQGKPLTVDLSNAKFPFEMKDIVRVDRSKTPAFEFAKKNYGYKFLEGEKVLYLAYNRCASDPENPSGKFFQTMWEEIDAKKPAALVIDLRANGGGNSSIFYPVLKGLSTRGDLNRYGKVYCLIGRGTFSSAMMNAIELRKQTKAILVGEPTGGSPNSFGETKTFELPYSKINVQYCTKRFDLTDGKEQTVAPDVMLNESSSTYFAGRDYVFDAVVARILKTAKG